MAMAGWDMMAPPWASGRGDEAQQGAIALPFLRSRDSVVSPYGDGKVVDQGVSYALYEKVDPRPW
jgi:hypothetical protein